MKETKKDILNRLFVENNLTEEDVFKHQHYTIITRNGIEKIQANMNIYIEYEVIKCEPNFAVVKAKGELREALACLQMLAYQLNLPYKNDSIEKILRDVINKGRKPTRQILGAIASVMGLHATLATVDKKMGTRIPSSSLIVSLARGYLIIFTPLF